MADGANVLKDPGARLAYGFDWSEWLGADTITASTWTVPADLTVYAQDFDTTSTEVVLSGGTVGEIHMCTNHITTAAGYEDERSIRVRMIQR